MIDEGRTLRVNHRLGGPDHDVLGERNIAHQARGSLPEQGNHAGGMGRGHAGTAR